MVILTNVRRFPPEWRSLNGSTGTSAVASTLFECLRKARSADFLLINCDPRLVLQLCAAFALLPFLRRPVIAVDLVLQKPESAPARLAAFAKRILFGRVDRFIHYFTDLCGYRQFYGIGPERSSFVPFRPTLRYNCETPPSPDGEYVLCFGWSVRDYDTFLAAMERLPYPAAIPEPDFGMFRRHGSRFTRPLSRLPANVRVLSHEASSYESQASLIAGAKVVVMPILRSSLRGISTPLNAMLLGKCVIMSEGPQTRGLFTDEMLTVPPEDADALAAVIRRAWEDRDLRDRTAAAGYKYAAAMGGEAEFRQRLIDAAASWYSGRPHR